MQEVRGYKTFTKDYKNRHGMKFIEGKTYIDKGDIQFGNTSKHGFHMCKRIEDTFRYFPCFEEEVQVAKVTGSGKIVEYEDDYYGYYNMYAVEKIRIDKFLTREEIINELLNDKYIYEDRICRFIESYKLNVKELAFFKKKYLDNIRIIKDLEYYQEGKEDAFCKKM